MSHGKDCLCSSCMNQSRSHEPAGEEIGVGATTLDYLKVRYQWLGELIDETAAALKAKDAEIERLRARDALVEEVIRAFEAARQLADEQAPEGFLINAGAKVQAALIRLAGFKP